MNSKIMNCDVITRPRTDDQVLFAENEAGDGSMFVSLENYLLVPKEFLTAKEIAAIWETAGRRVQH